MRTRATVRGIALLALLAAMPVGAALDHVEGIQDTRIGVTVDAKPRSSLEGALGAVVDEVRPFLNRLLVKLLHEGAFVLGAGLPHEIDGGAVKVLPPPGRTVAAAGGFDGGRGGRCAKALRFP